jgi:hypothetical protein
VRRHGNRISVKNPDIASACVIARICPRTSRIRAQTPRKSRTHARAMPGDVYSRSGARTPEACSHWLNLHSIYYEWDRTDKRTSGKRGRADFRICVPGGFWLSAECKAAGESLSPEQATQATRLRNSGGQFVVVYSLGDLIEAIRGAAEARFCPRCRCPAVPLVEN